MENLTNNPGLQHLAEEIFSCLNAESIQACSNQILYFAGYSTSYDPKIFEKGVVIFIVLNATPL